MAKPIKPIKEDKSMIAHNRFESVILILAIGLVLVQYRGWIFPGVITWGDYWHTTKGAMLSWSLTAWGGGGFDGGFFVTALPLKPYLAFMGFLYRLFQWQPQVIERIVNQGSIVLFLIFSPWYLARTLGYRKIGIATTILVFNFNSVILFNMGLPTFALADVLSPLAVALFIQIVHRQRIREILLFAMTAGLQMIYELRFAYMTLFFCGLYLLYFLVSTSSSSNNRYSRWRLARALLFTMLVLSLLQTYWLLPLLSAKILEKVSATALVSLPVTLSPGSVRGLSYIELLHALGLQSPWWGQQGIVNPANPHFLFLPILAFSVFLFSIHKKKRILMFFGLAALIFCFLSKGSKPPFGGLNVWLYLHFPGFIMFRVSAKWWSSVVICYAVLIGGFIDYFITRDNMSNFFAWLRKRLKISFGIAKTISVALIIGAFFIIFPVQPISMLRYAKNVWVWTPYRVPEESKYLEPFLHSQPDFSCVLWLPYIYRFGYTSAQHPGFRGYDFAKELLPSLRSGDTRYNTHYVSYLKKPFILQILRLFSIKYIIVPPAPLGQLCIYGWVWLPPQYYLDLVGKVERLIPVDFKGKSKVYELPDYLPHIYTSSKSQLIAAKNYDEILLAIGDSSYLKEKPVLIKTGQDINLKGSLLSANNLVFQDMNLEDFVFEYTKSIKIPFSITRDSQRLKTKVDKSGTYELWLDRSNPKLENAISLPLKIKIDRKIVYEGEAILIAKEGEDYLKYLKLTELDLRSGQHIIEIQTDVKFPESFIILLIDKSDKLEARSFVENEMHKTEFKVSYIFTQNGDFIVK